MACGWVSAVLWLSVGLYGYLIVHHSLQAYLSRQRAINLRLVGFLVTSLIFSLVDSMLYQTAPVPPPYAYWLTVGQFVASSICAVFFVEIMSDLYQLNLWRGVRWLWFSLAPLTAFSLMGWVIEPELKRFYLPLVGTYYWHGESSGLGVAFSLLYLGSFLWVFGVAFGNWRRLTADARITLGAMSVMIPIVLVDILVYYGVLAFVPTWNIAYWVLAIAMSIHLNLQIYRLSQELEQANAELESAYRQMIEHERLSTIGQVVRGIVHDLKNFFNTIQSLADVGIMRAQRDPAFQAEKYFENIGQSTRRAHQYLLDLLEMTREESELHMEPVEVAAVVNEVAKLSGARLLNPPVEIVNRIPRTLVMEADRRYLMQMFLNLTLNAMQAMKNWHGERRIEFDWVEHPEQTILVVSDTGPGLPPEVRDHLFEQSVTAKQGGSGIGLMLVRRALEKHGASVQVHSELGKGTQFVCVFPVAPRLMQVSEQTTVAV